MTTPQPTTRSYLNLAKALSAEYTFELSAPDEEDYRSFLLDLRPFLMDKEPIFFSRVSADLEGRLTDNELKRDCRHNRDAWKQVRKGTEIFSINGTVFTAVDFFMMVAYGDLFHLDEDRRAELAAMPRSVQDFAKFNLYSFGLNAARVISLQANLIRKALVAGAIDLKPR